MWIFAHRGAAPNRRIENTIPVFRAARQAGADLESDARLSRDKQVVLIHDAWYRVRLIPLPVRWQSAARLARGGACTIDQFSAALGADFEFSIDLKDTRCGPALIDSARTRLGLSHLWLVSDNVELLTELRAASAQVRLVHEARHRDIGDPRGHATMLAAAQIDAMNSAIDSWDAGLVDHVHSCGLRAFGSLAESADAFARGRALGIDAMYTDDVALAAPGTV
ncbi:MAG: glycerophosphodiester phosphodiesterase [Ilumatobacteraceae bacterium]